ncbi:dynein axonemal intermediate chain 4 isoform X2 [Mus musculus]|uniref:dynein axonemal intermediate chain 4 isoform X2 n=1 Tax=Mus musculus TaxID=10090 RepID=UPI0003D7858D|nr:dynein axonemal intermediate chain 4 isoform X2 [Mus musculus]|eukprot:XP_006503138.1 PREDICTED: WD repeat-containing protein 78 isoform X2 [Mus musculus]
MHSSPTSTRKQASFAASASAQPRKSISFINPSKSSAGKGYAASNPNKLAVSRTMGFLTDMKPAEKLNVPSAKTVQVLDSKGVDVTPRPLYHPDPHAASAKPNKLLTSQEGSLGSDYISSYSLYQNTLNPSMLGQYTRSVLGSSSVSKSSISTTESMSEDLEDSSYKRDRLASFTDVRVLRSTAEAAISKEELEKTIEIILTETETLRFFDLPTVMFSTESEEAEKIIEKNKKYETLCRNRLGNDLYVERMMQTFNGAPKNKEVQCEKIILEEKGVVATTWDLYDSYNIPETLLAAKRSGYSSKGSLPAKDRDPKIQDSESSSLMDIENVILAKVQEDEEDNSEAILKSDKLHQDLFYMERVLMENVFQPKLAAYRQLPVYKEHEPEEPEETLQVENLKVAEDEPKKEDEEEVEMELELEIATEQSTIPANLERLWSFSCDLTKGLNVSSLSWNKANPWPERIYQSSYGVTSVDFSNSSPNLLAVGYHNGTVAIYNVQSSHNIPVLDSSESPQKHLGPVWQVQWIEQDRGTTGDDKREILVSISADGRISKWIIRKGLDCHDLMRLKRTTATGGKKGGEKEKKGEALISRQAPGMCFAFHPKDTNIYLAGTEEGLIHKCSCSYNEQYLETYRGHKGPVYKVTWNPFCPDVFLSCSADWGVMIWHQDTVKPFLSFYPTTYVVYDVSWSPKSAYIFAAANENRVEIWDLQISTLDPLIVNVANPGIKFTTVLFAKETDCLLVGDSDGQVAVYELRNMPTASDTSRDWINEIYHFTTFIWISTNTET